MVADEPAPQLLRQPDEGSSGCKGVVIPATARGSLLSCGLESKELALPGNACARAFIT